MSKKRMNRKLSRMKMINTGDKVKVIGQDITGTVLRVHYDTNEVVVQDEHSEYEHPDDELVYKIYEVKKEDE